jgi:hypothetical protein
MDFKRCTALATFRLSTRVAVMRSFVVQAILRALLICAAYAAGFMVIIGR